MDVSRFEAVTFDCYGTLIDWESDILVGVRQGCPGLQRSDREILEAYSEIEPALQAGDYRPYRDVLRGVVVELGRRFGCDIVDVNVLANSLPSWKPFADSVAALKRLKRRFKLGVISNVDDDLFAGTARQLEVTFDVIVTAQQVRSYKPSLRNFEEALARLWVTPDRVLHVAESLFMMSHRRGSLASRRSG